MRESVVGNGHKPDQLMRELLSPEVSGRIMKRIRKGYEFALRKYQEIKGSADIDEVVDIGTHKGIPGLIILGRSVTETIRTIDCDTKKIAAAKQQPALRQYLPKIKFINGFAQEILDREEDFPSGSADLVVMIEVLGAGFEGNTDDLQRVFQGVHKVLKEDGLFVFTAKNPIAANIIEREFDIKDPKGVQVSRKALESVLDPYFDTQWYGQMVITQQSPRSSRYELPIHEGVDINTGQPYREWNKKAYIPRLYDAKSEEPLFIFAVCRPKRHVV